MRGWDANPFASAWSVPLDVACLAASVLLDVALILPALRTAVAGVFAGVLDIPSVLPAGLPRVSPTLPIIPAVLPPHVALSIGVSRRWRDQQSHREGQYRGADP